ncbi:MAG: hypothetical protein J7L47_05635 [Candidatus Odinarchaeota archaeon]|nr:hypothetical protein [Candidatus Odinarchaeota archaeon]
MPGLKKSELLEEMARKGFFDAYEYYKQKWFSNGTAVPSQAHYKVLLVLYALNCVNKPLRVPLTRSEKNPEYEYTNPRSFWNIIELLYDSCSTTFKARYSELLDQTNFVVSDNKGEYRLTEAGAAEAIKQIKSSEYLRRFWIRLYNLIWGSMDLNKRVRQVLKFTKNWPPLSKSEMLSLFRRG